MIDNATGIAMQLNLRALSTRGNEKIIHPVRKGLILRVSRPRDPSRYEFTREFAGGKLESAHVRLYRIYR